MYKFRDFAKKNSKIPRKIRKRPKPRPIRKKNYPLEVVKLTEDIQPNGNTNVGFYKLK